MGQGVPIVQQEKNMKMLQWTSFVVIVAVVLVRGFWPSVFTLDSFSVGLLFLLAIPLVAPFLKHAKWFGAEFVFKDEISKADRLVRQSEQKAQETAQEGVGAVKGLETFSTAHARQLVDTDANLALAALRLEIERVLSLASASVLGELNTKRSGCSGYIAQLRGERVISQEQGEALRTVVQMCNKAVHGADVSEDDANDVISLADRLNNTFAVGYSINLTRNKAYKEQGLLCEWEHCVERFPLSDPPRQLSCPVFGHDCPGGMVARQACDKTIPDLPPERFVRSEE